MHPLLAIVGPTGTGKTRLGIRLALAFNGEIVNADSRQVYRGMDIGTAKPTPGERAQVPHHLVDIVTPDQEFSLAEYQKLAYRAIADIHRRGKLPVLVGGTGLYVWAVLEGWQIPMVKPDPGLRRTLQARAAGGGQAQLYEELVQADPAAAEKIDTHNVRRVIRALEVMAGSGQSFSSMKRRQPPDYDVFIIGLTAPRDYLYRIVDQRVDKMIERGLIGEVAKLLKIGYDISLSALSGIGYRQMARYLRDEMTLDEAVRQTKTETHRFIRHQYAWFRISDARIKWVDITTIKVEDIEAAIRERFGFVNQN